MVPFVIILLRSGRVGQASRSPALWITYPQPQEPVENLIHSLWMTDLLVDNANRADPVGPTLLLQFGDYFVTLVQR